MSAMTIIARQNDAAYALAGSIDSYRAQALARIAKRYADDMDEMMFKAMSGIT